MTPVQIEEFGNDIVLIDLENSMQITTRIDSIEEDYIVLSKPILFQIQTDPNTGQASIGGQPLGGPFRDGTKNNDQVSLDIRHIMFIHYPIDPIEGAYLQATTGIQVAPASTIIR
jgi:hypothetical protein